MQRGLGRGFLACAGRTGETAELLQCILHDPRWDPQLEERAAYYGRLAVAHDLDVELLAAAVRRGDPDGRQGALPADVLMEMAVRGRDDARAALRAELRHDGWLLALDALDDAEQEYGRRLLEPGDLRLVCDRPAEELERLFASHAHLPWRTWAATVLELGPLLESTDATEKKSRKPPAPATDTAMSTAELLRIAEPRNGAKVARVLSQRRDAHSIAAMEEAARGSDHARRLAALCALGAQGHAGLLEHAVELLESAGPDDGRRMAPVLRYLQALPPAATLPLARRWLNATGHAARAAEHILARHARAEDRTAVEAALAIALDDEAIYRACDMVEALTAIADPGSSEVLVRTFESIAYSWARPRVLRALAACRADAHEALAAEALWDCDREARELAAEQAPLTAEVRTRLEEICADDLEEQRVRDASRRRLA